MLAAERGAARLTLAAYRNDLVDLSGFLAARGVALDKADEGSLHDYLGAAATRRLAPRTLARRLSAIRQFFRFLLTDGVRGDDPTSGLDAPRLGRPLPKLLSETEVGRLIAGAEAWPGEEGMRLRVILELLYATGLRISELVTLPLAAAQRDPRFLLVRGKGGRERVVPLSEPSRQALTEYLACRPQFLPAGRASRFLFASRGREGHLTRQRCGQLLKELALGANLDPARLSPHVLRHAARQPPARRRRRSAQRAADARPRRHRDDADLHPCPGRPAAPAGRGRASAGATQMNGTGSMRHFLDFERPIAELEGKIEELRHLSAENGLNIAEEVGRLAGQVDRLLRQTYGKLTPWQKVLVARHPERPHCRDYLAGLTEEFTPLAGDRAFAEDAAVLGGIARFRGRSVVVLGTEKGADTEARVKHNFGMARPEGYRKATRLMRLAEHFQLPVLSFVDTAGAYPGLDAEARGQSEAIASAIETCLDIRVPVVAAVIGEGGSGGADRALAAAQFAC